MRRVFEAGAVLDEVVILFESDPGEHGPPYTQQNATCLHLEQMDERDWYLGIGNYTDAIEVTLWDDEQTIFSDSCGG